MFNDSSLKRALLLGLLSLAQFAPVTVAAKPAPLSLYQKIHNFETILSNASRSKFDEAELSRIKQLTEEAEVVLKAGDTTAAEKLYTQAWDAYQGAVKATQPRNNKTRDEGILASKIASIKALLKQMEAIDQGNEIKKTDQIESVKSLLAEAEATKDPSKALTIANQAYFTMKILLKDVRGGKKLTFDHTFSTKELKYADEHAYNEAHFGLLDTALERLHAKADDEYNSNVNNAKKLRELAEEEAEQKDYDSAIRDLVLSTREIMKALKHIGLPVPGVSLQE
ncbi:MAG: hypothetical protein FD134_2424 [Gallionellaceae bacterium]|nr:MAG: hypothetical protein FD134_2424 [Gallionellaceae bacterium]